MNLKATFANRRNKPSIKRLKRDRFYKWFHAMMWEENMKAAKQAFESN